MSKERIGTINGHEIFVDSGFDQVRILLDKVKQVVDSKRVKDGDKWILPIQFDGEKPLVAEIKIKQLSD